MDIQLANEHLALTVNYFEARYGPEWRSPKAVSEQFDELLGAGSRLLNEFREGRIELLPPDQKQSTGDDGF
jgi:hypothetical protein